MTESMVLIDPGGKILFFNKVALSYSDLVKRPLRKGDSLFDVLPDEHLDFTHFVIHEVSTKHISHTAESVFRHPTGHSIFFEVNYSPVVNSRKEVEQICIVGRDITPQKTFEKKTTQLIHELSNLIETANAVIFGVDAQTYITEWNSECVRITGFEKNEVFARRVSEVLEGSQVAEFNKVIQTVFSGQSVSNVEFRLKKKNASPVTILLGGTPKVSQAGKTVGALFVGQDVTELSEYRKSLEEKVRERTYQLQDALKKEKELVDIKNRFVSIASHEFKIPLNAISASAASLRRSLTLSPTEKEKFETIDLHVKHMKSLLDDVLTAGRQEAGKLRPTLQEIDLIRFLKGIIIDVVTATNNTHTVQASFPEAPLMMQSDEKLLRNIFVNLLSNAIKFSPAANRVLLTASDHGDRVSIVVRDFGIGIEPADLQRVFEAFNRGSNIGNIKGTGLGLSIVKKAVETLGGEISVDSKPGEGTTFTVVFKRPSAEI